MTKNFPPPAFELIPESAPFTAEQRSWLNGFFAGLISVDGTVATAASRRCRRRRRRR